MNVLGALIQQDNTLFGSHLCLFWERCIALPIPHKAKSYLYASYKLTRSIFILRSTDGLLLPPLVLVIHIFPFVLLILFCFFTIHLHVSLRKYKTQNRFVVMNVVLKLYTTGLCFSLLFLGGCFFHRKEHPLSAQCHHPPVRQRDYG